MTKREQINDLGITVKSTVTKSAKGLTDATKARGMLYFIKKSLTCLTNEIFAPLCSALARPHLKYAIQANCPYHRKNTTGSHKVGERS